MPFADAIFSIALLENALALTVTAFSSVPSPKTLRSPVRELILPFAKRISASINSDLAATSLMSDIFTT